MFCIYFQSKPPDVRSVTYKTTEINSWTKYRSNKPYSAAHYRFYVEVSVSINSRETNFMFQKLCWWLKLHSFYLHRLLYGWAINKHIYHSCFRRIRPHNPLHRCRRVPVRYIHHLRMPIFQLPNRVAHRYTIMASLCALCSSIYNFSRILSSRTFVFRCQRTDRLDSGLLANPDFKNNNKVI